MLRQKYPRTQVLAILEGTITNIGATFTQIAFQIATEALQTINICTVPRKSLILVSPDIRHQIPEDINPEIQIRADGIPTMGSAIGNEEFMNEFLQSKLAKTESLISKVSKITCLTSKYHILISSINNKLRHLCRSLSSSSPAVTQFCYNFDAVTLEFFLKEFHILNPIIS